MQQNDVLQAIESHPFTQEIMAQRALETIERRRKLAKRLDDLLIDFEAIPTNERATEDLRLELSRAEAKSKSLRAEIGRVNAKLFAERETIRHQVLKTESELQDSCDPTIQDSIVFFRERLDWLRDPSRIDLDNYGSERNIITWTKKAERGSNLAAIEAAISYCQAAIVELERMQLQPEPDHKRIAELKNGIPSIGTIQTIQVEKALDPGPVAPLGPSESEMTWRLGRVFEKAKQILKK